MDKINIVSSQAVLKMSSFSMDTRSRPHQTSMSRRFNSSTLFVADAMLHDSPDLVIHMTDLGSLEATGWAQESLASWRSSSTVARARRGVRCTVLLEHSRYQTLCVSLAAVWRHYDVVKLHTKKSVRGITRIFFFVKTLKLPHALQILFNSFCEEVYAATFFKVVQQQTIGKVGNSITRLYADNFWLQE